MESDEAWTADLVGPDWHGELLGARVVGVVALPDSDDCVAVLDLMDRPAGVEPWHPFANLVRASPGGDVLWSAEPPVGGLKSWTAVALRDGVIVATAWSLRCVVDPATGRITGTELTK